MHCSVTQFTPEWVSNQQLGVYRCGRTIIGILDLQAVVSQSSDRQSKITKKCMEAVKELRYDLSVGKKALCSDSVGFQN